MRRLFAAALLAGLPVAAGCGGDGGDGLVPVAGNVSVDGQPAGNAVVTFIPQGNTPGNGGTGMTDSTGRYEVTTPQGKKGLPPGQYKVTVSRPLNPDGSPPDPNTPPIESSARETVLPKFSSPEKTELTAAVAAGDNRAFDFAVQSVKKK
ncbi:MAG TPA: carboxypeptidase-like regulatory domain-containing protein [Gemmataceae bacterium]|nr:carboxypeptidase-like regulatory domain-containing protein [Gemmataceae bacterium]